jgi:phage terminase large subunit-like protein
MELHVVSYTLEKRPVFAEVARASVAGTILENGQAYSPSVHPLLEDWELELLTFPNATHDDMVDTFGYAARQLSKVDVGGFGSSGSTITGNLG